MVSEDLVRLIKNQEGFRSTAYVDAGGRYAIGYGLQTYPNGQPVKQGDTIDKATAENALLHRLNRDTQHIQNLAKKNGVEYTPNELAALTSFTYNTGLGVLTDKSGIAQAFRAGDKTTLTNKMAEYNKAENPKTKTLEVFPGLVRRREAEINLFKGISGNSKISRDIPAPTSIETISPNPPKKSLSANDLSILNESLTADLPRLRELYGESLQNLYNAVDSGETSSPIVNKLRDNLNSAGLGSTIPTGNPPITPLTTQEVETSTFNTILNQQLQNLSPIQQAPNTSGIKRDLGYTKIDWARIGVDIGADVVTTGAVHGLAMVGGSILGGIGAAAGSIVPGAGTAIGGAAGFTLGYGLVSFGGHYIKDTILNSSREGKFTLPTRDDLIENAVVSVLPGAGLATRVGGKAVKGAAGKAIQFLTDTTGANVFKNPKTFISSAVVSGGLEESITSGLSPDRQITAEGVIQSGATQAGFGAILDGALSIKALKRADIGKKLFTTKVDPANTTPLVPAEKVLAPEQLSQKQVVAQEAAIQRQNIINSGGDPNVLLSPEKLPMLQERRNNILTYVDSLNKAKSIKDIPDTVLNGIETEIRNPESKIDIKQAQKIEQTLIALRTEPEIQNVKVEKGKQPNVQSSKLDTYRKLLDDELAFLNVAEKAINTDINGQIAARDIDLSNIAVSQGQVVNDNTLLQSIFKANPETAPKIRSYLEQNPALLPAERDRLEYIAQMNESMVRLQSEPRERVLDIINAINDPKKVHEVLAYKNLVKDELTLRPDMLDKDAIDNAALVEDLLEFTIKGNPEINVSKESSEFLKSLNDNSLNIVNDTGNSIVKVAGNPYGTNTAPSVLDNIEASFTDTITLGATTYKAGQGISQLADLNQTLTFGGSRYDLSSKDIIEGVGLKIDKDGTVNPKTDLDSAVKAFYMEKQSGETDKVLNDIIRKTKGMYIDATGQTVDYTVHLEGLSRMKANNLAVQDLAIRTAAGKTKEQLTDLTLPENKKLNDLLLNHIAKVRTEAQLKDAVDAGLLDDYSLMDLYKATHKREIQALKDAEVVALNEPEFKLSEKMTVGESIATNLRKGGLSGGKTIETVAVKDALEVLRAFRVAQAGWTKNPEALAKMGLDTTANMLQARINHTLNIDTKNTQIKYDADALEAQLRKLGIADVDKYDLSTSPAFRTFNGVQRALASRVLTSQVVNALQYGTEGSLNIKQVFELESMNTFGEVIPAKPLSKNEAAWVNMVDPNSLDATNIRDPYNFDSNAQEAKLNSLVKRDAVLGTVDKVTTYTQNILSAAYVLAGKHLKKSLQTKAYRMTEEQFKRGLLSKDVDKADAFLANYDRLANGSKQGERAFLAPLMMGDRGRQLLDLRTYTDTINQVSTNLHASGNPFGSVSALTLQAGSSVAGRFTGFLNEVVGGQKNLFRNIGGKYKNFNPQQVKEYASMLGTDLAALGLYGATFGLQAFYPLAIIGSGAKLLASVVFQEGGLEKVKELETDMEEVSFWNLGLKGAQADDLLFDLSKFKAAPGSILSATVSNLYSIVQTSRAYLGTLPEGETPDKQLVAQQLEKVSGNLANIISLGNKNAPDEEIKNKTISVLESLGDLVLGSGNIGNIKETLAATQGQMSIQKSVPLYQIIDKTYSSDKVTPMSPQSAEILEHNFLAKMNFLAGKLAGLNTKSEVELMKQYNESKGGIGKSIELLNDF